MNDSHLAFLNRDDFSQCEGFTEYPVSQETQAELDAYWDSLSPEEKESWNLRGDN
ncbi:MAG: hypothetical protein ACREOZ_02170 [Gloeomargaritales cyanobacterium]